jgi:hypothetical protein
MRAEVNVPPTPDETFSQSLKGFGTMVERITPWLLDLGSWIFGALIAFDLLILAALLTVGPADLAALIATAAFALALPPTVAGFFLLRLLEDIKSARLEDVAVEAFQDAGFSGQSGPIARCIRVHRPATNEDRAHLFLLDFVAERLIDRNWRRGSALAYGMVDQRRLRRGDTGQSRSGSRSDGQLAVSRQTAVKSLRYPEMD